MSTRSQKKIILKTLKSHKTIWHPESTLVYKSRKDRIVIGRFVDGELIPLDSETLDLCEEWGNKFPPDESLIDKESDEEQEGEQESENDEQQESEEQESEGQEEEEQEEEEQQESEGQEGEQESEEDEGQEGEQESDTQEEEKQEPEDEQPPVAAFNLKKDNYEEYFKSFMTEVRSMCKKNDSQLSTAEAKLEKKIEDFVELEAKLKNITTDYNAIKKKFDAMKSLFA